MGKWRSCAAFDPPQNKSLMTRIADEKGVRKEQHLLLDGRLWWLPDRSMYVCYAPTHWLDEQPQEQEAGDE